MRRFFARWPLLITGLIVIGWAVTQLTPESDKSDPRALLLGVGCVLLGAGLVMVVRGDHRDDDDNDES